MSILTNRWLQKAIGLEKFMYLSILVRQFILSKNSSEYQYVKILSVIKNREGIIIDIGAASGLQTISFAKEFPNSKVVAFDPIEHNVRLIEKQKAFYKLSNIKVIQKALGNTDDICELILEGELNYDNYNNYNLGCSLETKEKKEVAGRFKSFINRLDSIDEIKKLPLPLIAIHINSVKFEWAILQGGLDLIKRDKPVIFSRLLDNYNRVVAIAVLKQEGYIPLIMDEGRLEYYDSKIHIGDSFIFIHRTAKLDPLREINLWLHK